MADECVRSVTKTIYTIGRCSNCTSNKILPIEETHFETTFDGRDYECKAFIRCGECQRFEWWFYDLTAHDAWEEILDRDYDLLVTNLDQLLDQYQLEDSDDMKNEVESFIKAIHEGAILPEDIAGVSLF